MVTLTSIFFLIADQIIGYAVIFDTRDGFADPWLTA